MARPPGRNARDRPGRPGRPFLHARRLRTPPRRFHGEPCPAAPPSERRRRPPQARRGEAAAAARGRRAGRGVLPSDPLASSVPARIGTLDPGARARIADRDGGGSALGPSQLRGVLDMPLKCTRRDCLRIGAFSFLGMATKDLLSWADPAAARADSCILIYLNGGMSHLDTFDLKPDAPAEIRGAFKPIPTSVPGLRISEHLPRLAQVMDRCALVRSLTSSEGNHDRATHYMLTGWHPTPALVYPSAGSVAAREAGPSPALPRYIAVPAEPAYGGAGYLGAAFEPFCVASDPSKPGFRVRDLEPAVPPARIDRRKAFLRELGEMTGRLEEAAGGDANAAQAFRLLGSKEARAAFD